jgi:hypothetical protein
MDVAFGEGRHPSRTQRPAVSRTAVGARTDSDLNADAEAVGERCSTPRQVVARLGQPRAREDEVYRFYGTSLAKLGQGTRRCLFYNWAPNPDRSVRFCFVNGKLVDKA